MIHVIIVKNWIISSGDSHSFNGITSGEFDDMLAQSKNMDMSFGGRKDPSMRIPDPLIEGSLQNDSYKLADKMMNLGSESKPSLKLPTNFYTNLRRDYRL